MAPGLFGLQPGAVTAYATESTRLESATTRRLSVAEQPFSRSSTRRVYQAAVPASVRELLEVPVSVPWRVDQAKESWRLPRVALASRRTFLVLQSRASTGAKTIAGGFWFSRTWVKPWAAQPFLRLVSVTRYCPGLVTGTGGPLDVRMVPSGSSQAMRTFVSLLPNSMASSAWGRAQVSTSAGVIWKMGGAWSASTLISRESAQLLYASCTTSR